MHGISTGTAVRIEHFEHSPVAVQEPLSSGNSLMDRFGPGIRSELLERGNVAEVQRGEVITSPGEKAAFVDFPLDAVISHYRILMDGRTAEVAMTGNEGAVGASTALGNGFSGEFSEVIVPGKIVRVGSDIFKDVSESSMELSKTVFTYLNEHLERISRRVICSNYHSVEERLALWLLLVRDRCNADELAFTQEQVSFFLGVHRPSVTLAMQELRELGVVDYRRGKIILRDLQRLRQVSCSCYPSLSVGEPEQAFAY
ncbi:MAG: Crp/Fnr family transcriptional regulator [Acidobacteria bacterium]|nr:MAG: Crp/Fnr family transcriptional regulator [Acidobacteriota bacterium]REK01807.1 MAG: Crp/Fnr family transcriptional regulator [Acidobacteriota bacterium]REK14763.1 MAG: Crp/Fnr family transcriptional regulator [Acidobacteriota bacterium]REK45478.1 MAG: Crp/Fnr family transcriptional regulator [Acidobacteriota bacterium]